MGGLAKVGFLVVSFALGRVGGMGGGMGGDENGSGRDVRFRWGSATFL